MSEEQVIRIAEFNKNVCMYWLLSGTMLCCFTCVGIPFLILWIPLGLIFTGRYLDRMKCELTAKSLRVEKGIMTRIEKTIPLEKITDVAMVQGPIMRLFGVKQLAVETAGSSSGGALVGVTGIVDAEDFRQAILDQKDQLVSQSAPVTPKTVEPAQQDVLVEIRDVLLRLEETLKKRD